MFIMVNVIIDRDPILIDLIIRIVIGIVTVIIRKPIIGHTVIGIAADIIIRIINIAIKVVLIEPEEMYELDATRIRDL